MRAFCHRCGGELANSEGESSFCPHCGAPQLRVLEENVVAAPSSTTAEPATGALPPPHPGRVRWATVVTFAAAVAAVAALLMVGVLWLPVAFPFAWLWTVCGAVIVLGLYQRRYPETLVNAGVGARVGLIYGLLAVFTLALALAAGGLVARFGLHAMGGIDTWLAMTVQQGVDQQKLQAAQKGLPALTPDQLRIFYSPEFRAGLALSVLAACALFLVGFSTLGGAVGGFLRVRRRPAA
jgi:hypothetical protein